MKQISDKLAQKLAPIVKVILSDTDQYILVFEILRNSEFRKELCKLHWNNEMVDFYDGLEKEYVSGVICPECSGTMNVECPMAVCTHCNEEIYIDLPNGISEAVCRECIGSRMHTCPMKQD